MENKEDFFYMNEISGGTLLSQTDQQSQRPATTGSPAISSQFNLCMAYVDPSQEHDIQGVH